MTIEHPSFPPRVSWPWIMGAVGVWVVCALLGTPPTARIAHGAFEGELQLTTDVYDGQFGRWAIGKVDAGRVLVEIEAGELGRGDTLVVAGNLGGEPGSAAGRSYGAVLRLREVFEHEPSRNLAHRAGLAVRSAVLEDLEPMDEQRALLAGFLIGDISEINDVDRDAMRRSGLAHFVAVSGSNVALFLGLLAVAAGPLALGPKRRAVIGLLGLPVYAAATRFEPSVMRASAMAGIALGGRLLGIVLEAWQLMSLAVVVLLLADPALTSNVGFQLSVAATAGVLVGARWPAGKLLMRALVVTLGAQLAVAPLLILHFGTVPLLSPLVNVVAAPLVAAATIVGAVGVAAVGVLIPVAAMLAGLVLGLARGAAAWPQLTPVQLGALMVAAFALLAFPRLQAVAVPIGALGLALLLLVPASALPAGGVAVLDVGQGDSILIHGGSGHFALVDGGPDPPTLIDRLRRYGVRSLDLVVLTHVHADHAMGLTGIVGQIPIGEVWADPVPHTTSAYEELAEALTVVGVPVHVPKPGHGIRMGTLQITVEGPLRRYASPNDQSIVLTVTGDTSSMLLSGDIETFAQADLEGLKADVLKVPHQGAGTSDPDWLESVGASTAVISVGPNQWGHPVPWVIDSLTRAGALVLRTDEVGDVVVDLSAR